MPAFRQWLTPTRVKAAARWLRIGALTVVVIAIFLLLLLFIHRGILPVVAWLIPSLHKPFLDFAVYGAVPLQEYVSFDLKAPSPWRLLWDKSCEGGHILVGPNGPDIPKSGPVIMDTNGELVWMEAQWNDIMNFNIQTFKDKDYLTFWAGNKQGGVGQGDMLLLDSNYKVAYRIHAVGEGQKGDIHEFRITKDNTALITVFNNTQYDLRNFGLFRPSDGWLTDGMFQEIDIETNELLFEWRAIEHFDPNDTYYFDPFGGYFESHPFDYYHLNSVEKDSKGNYLCSSRHYHHIIYIEGKTGKVLWELGGRSKDFKDLSHGKATEHKWQHNARWYDEEASILTFMDNGVAGPLHVDAPYSKGTMVQLDLENMTATHLHSYISQGKVRAASQGNLQGIDDDQILVGWGATAAYSEFNLEGHVLCEVHFAASLLFWFERWKSYRVYRHFGWVGEPEYPPSAKIQGGSLYVSWNGATEVKYFELQGGRDGEFQAVETKEKTRFEEIFELPDDQDYDQYRIVALDSSRKVMQFSDPVDLPGSTFTFVGFIFGICAAIGALLGIWFFLRMWTARRARDGKKAFKFAPMELFSRREDYRYSKL
jgi:hypothetical protein